MGNGGSDPLSQCCCAKTYNYEINDNGTTRPDDEHMLKNERALIKL